MPQANAEADPMFQLLTDALRAGPGSTEWHQAVAKLKSTDGAGDPNVDEYKLLIAAREHLESGREYKSVRAGAGFTRKLFDDIERDGGAGGPARGLPTANIIAIASAMGILAVLIGVGYLLFRGGTPPVPTPRNPLKELEDAYFPTEVASAKFEGVGTGVPAGWRTIGSLPLDATKGGLKPPAGSVPEGQTLGGGLVAPDALAADEPFAAEVALKPGRPADDLIVQVFVSADTDFTGASATSPNELVWLARGASQRVVTVDRVQAETPRPDAKGDAVPVRVLVDRENAVVLVNKQRVWAGPHGLPAQPRHVGVRFIRVGGTAKPQDTAAAVQSIRVLKK